MKSNTTGLCAFEVLLHNYIVTSYSSFVNVVESAQLSTVVEASILDAKARQRQRANIDSSNRLRGENCKDGISTMQEKLCDEKRSQGHPST